MTEADYIAYFEALVRKNRLFADRPQTDKLVYVARDDNRTEIEQAVRTKLRLPVLILDQFYDDLDRTQDNFRQGILGGLSILVSCRAQDAQDLRRARDEARQIARGFLNRMVRDCRESTGSLYSRRIQPSTRFNGEPVPVIAEIATGWGYPFEWWLPTSFKVESADWTDL